MFSITLGIDISKDKVDVALYQEDLYRNGTFSNDDDDDDDDGYRRLSKWLKNRRRKEAAVCIELAVMETASHIIFMSAAIA